MGRATNLSTTIAAQEKISIHALRGEGDIYRSSGVRFGRAFQSTPSVGRATINSGGLSGLRAISIHALRGEGDGIWYLSNMSTTNFNPRPPWGGRPGSHNFFHFFAKFQSTPSVGRATATDLLNASVSSHFNPRPPWGGRLLSNTLLRWVTQFQSTPSVGRATDIFVLLSIENY